MFRSRPDRGNEAVLLGRSNVGKSTLMREVTGHTFDTGQRPGVTRQPNHYDWAGPDFVLTDLPGFGFMKGVPEEQREQIKTDVVRYIEEYADSILVGILVLDGKAAVDIIDRHSGPDEVPHDVELWRSTRWTKSTTGTNGWTTSRSVSDWCHPGSSGKRRLPPSAPNAGTSRR